MKDLASSHKGSFSRRTFIKSLGTTAVATAGSRAQAVATELEKVDGEKVVGPGAVAVALKVNGETLKLQLEPRATLLDALRNYSSVTGAKEGCDRASCGACTVLMGDLPIYSCQKLAIEAQGQPIITVEGLARNGELSKVQKAFLEKDALMCGYCTPGFLISVTALLKKHPRPTADQIRHACAGNLCRCGTQPRIMEAVLQAAGLAAARTTETEIIDYARLA
jgi:aerobic-type carbon monoxide dehydrogenase small subunit (CoxS/CutS family)